MLNRKILQLWIILLFTSDLVDVFGPSNAEKTSNVQQKEIEADRRSGNFRKTENNIASQKTGLAPRRSDGNASRHGPTLEECYGGIGRWIQRYVCKRQYPKGQIFCHCERCYCGPSENLAEKTEVSCEDVRAKVCDERSSGKPTEDSASTIRFLKSRTEAPNRVCEALPRSLSGKSQHHFGRERKTYRSTKSLNWDPKDSSNCQCKMVCCKGLKACYRIFCAPLCCLATTPVTVPASILTCSCGPICDALNIVCY